MALGGSEPDMCTMGKVSLIPWGSEPDTTQQFYYYPVPFRGDQFAIACIKESLRDLRMRRGDWNGLGCSMHG